MSKILSAKEAAVLRLLVEREELCGLEMVELSEERLKRGTIYVTLQRMEKKGLVSSRLRPKPEGESGLARRLYKSTPLGARNFQAFQAVEAVPGAPTEVPS